MGAFAADQPALFMSGRILSTSAGTNQEAFHALDWVLFWSISLIWGSSFLLMDIGLDAFEPGLVTLMRVGFGAAVLMLFPAARTPVDRYDRPRILALSVIWVAVPFTIFPIAQQWVNSAITGMLNGAMPIFAAIVATILLRKLPRGAQALGLLIGFAGVVAISAPSAGEGGSEALGVALIVLATAFYGVAVNIAAPLNQKYGAMPVMARMLAWATIWTAPLGLIGLSQSSFAWDAFLAVLAAGVIGTGLAYYIMGTLVGRVGSVRASFITYLIPVFALFLGVWLRDDVVTVIALIGVVLVIVGALLASRREA